MPSPAILRTRLRLIADIDQLVERLQQGDESALAEAQDRLSGIALSADCHTMSLLFRAVSRVIDEQQISIDNAGFKM